MIRTIDDYLGEIYAADLKGKKNASVGTFRIELAADADLKTAAKARLSELDKLIAVRGKTACAYSTKYQTYLQEALG